MASLSSSNTDALTGLPNRVLLQERLTQAIAQARRSHQCVGVLFIDLDRFKNVNDTLGHRIGDELLKRVTATLSHALRESDLLARLGGDEFMVIVEDFDDPEVLNRVAQKLQDAVSQPFEIEEHDIYVTSSIGISVYPDDGDAPEELLKHADVAMYRSKELGRNTYQFFDADLAARRLEQHTLETALRTAVKEEALMLHYQPVVRIEDKAIVGAEALLRWHDPEHGDVPPKVFIPLAEESGLIHALGDWVMRTAATQCAAWHRAGLPLTVSVNLSGPPVLSRGLGAAYLRNRARGRLQAGVDRAGGHRVESAARLRLGQEGAAATAAKRASRSRSTTSVPAIRACRTSSIFRSTRSRSTSHSSPTSRPIRATPRSPRRSSRWRAAWGCGWLPRAWRRASSSISSRARGCHCIQGFWISAALPADSVRRVQPDAALDRGNAYRPPPRQNRRVPTLALYPFRFRDPLSGKWVRARHKMQVPEMQRHYPDWEITGAPEFRHVTESSVQPFNPFEPPAPARPLYFPPAPR